ncbi:hypothetical protein DFA_00485 [Cavenderia fasciculata]|uniref:Uncharacterized protein n=1 Tax=Cavenderia fasciculata TaxID=261658 RepID=F4PS26_CACFS|nr:uncharacterized protein DFA_00485 [Cavenderia fasciculata]EGG20624.1 hypothetical protein DFA_00485 [Cavenderia fasciculata]|eukprot:XP_004358474.1 hypothetical protein DFA_00485 [Cavenderia fasciculata]
MNNHSSNQINFIHVISNYIYVMMEQPTDQFIAIIVTLANTNNKKDDIDDTIKKNDFDSDKVAEWLLYLMVKGTFPNIKEKAGSLLDKLLAKRGKELQDEAMREKLDFTLMLRNFFNRRGVIDNDYVTLVSKLLTIISKPPSMDDRVSETVLEEVIYRLMKIFVRSNNPSWMRKLAPQIIETLIVLLDNHRRKEYLVNSTKRMVYDYLTVLAKNNVTLFNNTQVERIIVNLYAWLISTVKDVSMEEWTETNSKIDIDKNFYSFNYDEEKDYIPPTNNDDDPTTYNDDVSDGRGITAHSKLAQFIQVFGPVSVIPIFNQCNTTLSNSTQWKERYASMVGLATACKFSSEVLFQRFPIILNLALKLFEDENIRVRWASIQCLIILSIEFGDLMVQVKQQVFNVIRKSIRQGTNERIQSSGCVLVQTMTDILTNEMIGDNVLNGLCRGLLALVESPKFYVAENALLSLQSIVGVVKNRFNPYFGNIISISLSLLEKHNATKESRILRSHAIKAFVMCSSFVDEKKYSKSLNKFLVFVKKNEKSFDMIVDVIRASYVFIQDGSQSFPMYFPMFVRMIANILETPLPTQQAEIDEMPDESKQDMKKVLLTLKGLNTILKSNEKEYDQEYDEEEDYQDEEDDEDEDYSKDEKLKVLTSYRPLAPFILDAALGYQELEPQMCALRISMASYLVSTMGKDAMTLDQVESTVATYNRMKPLLFVMADQVRAGNQDIIGDNMPEPFLKNIAQALFALYGVMTEMIKYNSTIAIPLITGTTNILEDICDYLTEDDEEGTLAPIKAAVVLGVAAKLAKDRFSPYLTPVLQAIDTMLSEPISTVVDNKTSKEYAIRSIGEIIRYVPQVSSMLNVIIPKWLNKLPLVTADKVPIIETFCSIIRLYPDQFLGGEQYQHVVKLHGFILKYRKTTCQKDEIELLSQTWLFIQESFKSNWDNITSETTRNTLSKLIDPPL